MVPPSLMFHLSDLLLQKPQYFFMFSAAQYILLAVFHPDEEAFFIMGIIPEIVSDEGVMKIAPIPHKASAST